jgi:acetoin utilization protein AcuB
MLVSQYMSQSPVTIGVNEDYGSAFDIMKARDLHHLPVVNDDGDVVGIVTRRDLQLGARFFHEAPTEISEVMHAPVVTIAPDANLSAAAERMIAERIGCLPVVDGERRLAGMLTETDLFRALKDLLARED